MEGFRQRGEAFQPPEEAIKIGEAIKIEEATVEVMFPVVEIVVAAGL